MNIGGQRRFSGREVAVMGLLAAGQGMPEIARQLGISQATVTVHLAMIRYKAGVDLPARVPPAPGSTPAAAEAIPSFAHWLRAVV